MTAVHCTKNRPRILVADDETIIAMQIGELLEAEGFELAGVAATACQAVDMARALRPDLVLMDIVMPSGGSDGAGPGGNDGMDDPADGIDACSMIQRDLNIPVVLLSAHGEEHFLRRARRALPAAYLVKPCQNTQIRAALEVALALRVHNEPSALFGAQSPPPPEAALSLELDVDALPLLQTQVIPCGIFLAEALTNAIKHAFPHGKGGVVRVSLHGKDGEGELCIADNGEGLAGDPKELGRNSFGLQCLQAAADQLEGVMGIVSEPGRGTRVSVRFPLFRDYQSRSA